MSYTKLVVANVNIYCIIYFHMKSYIIKVIKINKIILKNLSNYEKENK